MPNTCWTCKSPDVPRLMAGVGTEAFYRGKGFDRGHQVVNAIGCGDCHMPYHSEGGMKFTDHHIRSPLSNIANPCQVCHRQSESGLLKNVYERQDKIIENRDKLEQLLVRAHVEAKHAWDLGASEESMKDVLTLIRHAQWRWDYAAASHGGSFHSPIETSRIIGTGIDKAQEARLGLARILASQGHNETLPYPDISTKAKAQAFVGVDVQKLNQEKQVFLEQVVPEWLRKARENGLLSAGSGE